MVDPRPSLRAVWRAAWRTGTIAAVAALIAGCALLSGIVVETGERPPAPVPSPRLVPPPDRVAAQRARPAAARADVASWYGAWHHGRLTASGEAFDMDAFTAAHPSFPLGSCIEVVHLRNGRRVFVRVNDRGPYIPGRTIDVSYRAARDLDMVSTGLARVRLRTAKLEACGPGA